MSETTKILHRHTDEVLYEGEGGTRELVVAAVREDANLKDADLGGANLHGADLKSAYLWDADLKGADLGRANLHGANLKGADLQDANLKSANLKGACLMGANLHGADLRGADLKGAYLMGADLRRADLRGARLRGACLWDACLACVYLQGADLKDADLKGVNLRIARLKDANLRGAKLQGADLWFAKFQGANLQGADLQGAKLNWQSRAILSEILWRAADTEPREMLAAYVGRAVGRCWESWQEWDHPEREWARRVLAGWVQPGDGAPDWIREAPMSETTKDELVEEDEGRPGGAQDGEQIIYPCGCVTCVCDDPEGCHGCGARYCGNPDTCAVLASDGAQEGPLNALAEEIVEINRANGWEVLRPEEWDDPRRVPTVLALIHSEVSEALEGFRKDDRENFMEELADVLIRVLDAAGGLGIDMDREVRRKLEINRGRGHKHGGKRV